jgi:small GTP-binding protein
MLGDKGSGKRSLVSAFCSGKSPGSSTSSVCLPCEARVIVDNTAVSLGIFDLAGVGEFYSMASEYCIGSVAAVCVFDVTDEGSFSKVITLVREIRDCTGINVVLVLVGNKCDARPCIDLARFEKVARTMGAKFFLTSALRGEGVTEMFEWMLRSTLHTYNSHMTLSNSILESTLQPTFWDTAKQDTGLYSGSSNSSSTAASTQEQPERAISCEDAEFREIEAACKLGGEVDVVDVGGRRVAAEVIEVGEGEHGTVSCLLCVPHVPVEEFADV